MLRKHRALELPKTCSPQKRKEKETGGLRRTCRSEDAQDQLLQERICKKSCIEKVEDKTARRKKPRSVRQ